jgi:hypothetical protein
MSRSLPFLLVFSLLAWLQVGCAKNPDKHTTVAAGAERGPCYGNGTCNDGLICLSELCVRPPPADCAKVAQKVGQLTLGNYAPRDQRAQFETQITNECKNAFLTKEQGQCIIDAASVGALAQCEKPLGMADCDRIMAHVQKVAANDQEINQYLARGPEEFARECKRMGLTRADENCILAATDASAIKNCRPGQR